MDKHKKSDSSDRTPFQDRINVNMFFSGAHRRKLLDEVKKALGDKTAIVTITGEEGVGKSMICKMVEKELPAETFSVYLPTPLESFDDVVRVLALEVGTDSADKPVSSKILVDEIAAELEIRERRLVGIFDQSERMYLATIERIRKMLDKLNSESVLLQIVFAGRPSLLENLKQLAICNFNDAEERHFSLNPLGLSETYAYLNHCAQQRSSSRSKNVFTPEAAKKIYSMAQGNLRMTNMLAARSLEAVDSDTSFMVLLDNVADDGRGSARKGTLASAVSPAAIPRSRRRWAYGGAGMVLLLAAAFFVFNGDEQQKGAESTEQAVSREPPEMVPLPREDTEPVLQPAEPQTPVETTDGSKPIVAEETVQKNAAGQGEEERSRGVKESAVDGPAAMQEDDDKTLTVATADHKVAQEPSPPAAIAENNGDAAAAAKDRRRDAPVEPPAKTIDQQARAPAHAETVSEPVAGSGQAVDSRPAVEREMQSSQGTGEERSQPELTASSEETKAQEDAAAKIQEDVAEEPAYDEPVVFVGMKKRLPPPETEEGGAKKIVKIAPAKLKIPLAVESDQEAGAGGVDEASVDNLFSRALARGERWLQGQGSGSHTVQLMALSAGQAEENLKNRLRQEEYRRIADQLYIVKGNTSTVYVYHGEYADVDTARRARSTLPEFLRQHDPYTVSVEEATAKAASEP